MIEHLLSLADLQPERVRWLLGVAAEVGDRAEAFATALRGRTVAMTLDVDGSRSRISFLRAIGLLGGSGAFVPARDLGVRAAERPEAAAALLSRYADLLVASFSAHETLLRFAAGATVPVINGATDREHPCQALADLLVLGRLFPGAPALRVAWVGPPAGRLYAFALAAPTLAVDLVVCTPAAAPADPELLAAARARAEGAGTRIELVEEPSRAVRDADAVYASPRARGGPWVDAALLAAAREDAVLLHALPLGADPGVAAQGLEPTVSAALLQAQMRVPAQQALLLWLLEAV